MLLKLDLPIDQFLPALLTAEVLREALVGLSNAHLPHSVLNDLCLSHPREISGDHGHQITRTSEVGLARQREDLLHFDLVHRAPSFDFVPPGAPLTLDRIPVLVVLEHLLQDACGPGLVGEPCKHARKAIEEAEAPKAASRDACAQRPELVSEVILKLDDGVALVVLQPRFGASWQAEAELLHQALVIDLAQDLHDMWECLVQGPRAPPTQRVIAAPVLRVLLRMPLLDGPCDRGDHDVRPQQRPVGQHHADEHQGVLATLSGFSHCFPIVTGRALLDVLILAPLSHLQLQEVSHLAPLVQPQL